MANNKEIVYLRAKLYWAKVIGDPVDNYGKDGKEWVFDASLDEDGVKQVKSIKVQGKPALTLKDKDDERGKFITLKQKYRELRPDPRTGEKRFSKPPKIVDAAGNEWGDEKLGNGTVADIKFEVVDYGKGMYAGVYPQAIRILEHVPYAGGGDFAPLSSDDEFFGKAVEKKPNNPEGDDKAFKKDFHLPDANDDLDDDVPY